MDELNFNSKSWEEFITKNIPYIDNMDDPYGILKGTNLNSESWKEFLTKTQPYKRMIEHRLSELKKMKFDAVHKPSRRATFGIIRKDLRPAVLETLHPLRNDKYGELRKPPQHITVPIFLELYFKYKVSDIIDRKWIINLLGNIDFAFALTSSKFKRLPKTVYLLHKIFKLRGDDYRAQIADMSTFNKKKHSKSMIDYGTKFLPNYKKNPFF